MTVGNSSKLHGKRAEAQAGKMKHADSLGQQAGRSSQGNGQKGQINSGKDKGKQPQKAAQQSGRPNANDKGAKGKGKGKNDGKQDTDKLLAEPPTPKSLVNPEVYATLNEMLHSASVLTMQSFMHGALTVPKASEGIGSEGQASSGSGENDSLQAGKHLAMLARKRIGDMKTLAKKSVISL